MKLPQAIEDAIRRFREKGVPVYVVGGAVRDSLMGITPHDYDLTTPATPEEILAIMAGEKTFREGEKFGTIAVMTAIGPVEITTFRIDGTYTDNRKPDAVTFTADLKEDLARRDFTVNAMAYSSETGLVDPFGGRDDLENKILRAVGDPARRFSEDALRILRAFRFMGQLNMTLDPALLAAAKNEAYRIESLSAERVADEMNKILLQDAPSRVLYAMEEAGVLEKIFPELVPTVGYDQRNPHHDKTLFDHILCVVDQAPKTLPLRYAALFHDVNKPDTLTIDENGKGHFFGHDTMGAETAGRILARLKSQKALSREVEVLIKEHMKVHDTMTDKALRRQIKRVGEDYILDLYDLMAADMACTYGARDISFILERKARIRALMDEGIVSRNTLAVSGKDLIALGMVPGPAMGRLLKEMEDMALDDPETNEKNRLLAYAKRRIEDRNVANNNEETTKRRHP